MSHYDLELLTTSTLTPQQLPNGQLDLPVAALGGPRLHPGAPKLHAEGLRIAATEGRLVDGEPGCRATSLGLS